MTRQEHLAWCKQRALQYLDRGEYVNAIASMMSDVRKHPETDSHIGLQLGAMMSFGGFMLKPHEIRKWIEGFN